MEWMSHKKRKETKHRDGEVTFEKELSYSSSYFQMRNSGTLVTLVTVTAIKIWLKK